MANTDFGGDYGEAHSVADAGGEFIVAREFDLSFIQVRFHFLRTNGTNVSPVARMVSSCWRSVNIV
ncbi:MAG: hypothetical protein NXI00_22965 [Cytophagales bacterium]|nr:hypothetical protein [Cytophagales bacterium]